MSFHPLRLLWAGWMWLLLAIMVLAAALAVLLPSLRHAAGPRAIGRNFWLAGMPLHYRGLERCRRDLRRGRQSFSYLDGHCCSRRCRRASPS